MSWINAYARGLLVFLYFLVATVMLPNFVLRLGAIGRASDLVQDAVVLLVWGAGFVAGLYLLRRFQAKGIV